MRRSSILISFLFTAFAILIIIWIQFGKYFLFTWVYWLLLAIIAIVVFALLMMIIEKLTAVRMGRGEIDTRSSKDAIDRLAKADPAHVQEVAASQIQLLTTYHNLVLDQAKKSFLWALIAAAIGLLFFIAAVSSIIFLNLQNAAIISVISGALVEVISGINFYLYNQTSKQLSDFQSRLDKTQRFLLANSMCEGLKGLVKQQARSDLIKSIAPTSEQKTEVKTE